MHALYNSASPAGELERDVDAFFASGGTQDDLIRHLNMEYRVSGKMIAQGIRSGRALPLLEAVNDYSGCLIPVVALLADAGQVEQMEMVLNRRADVNMADEHGSALVRVARRAAAAFTSSVMAGGDASFSMDVFRAERALQLLIDRGVDLNATNRMGENALIVAAQAGHARVVKMLCAAGARVMDRSADGTNALHRAMLCAHDTDGELTRQVVLWLQSADVDVNAKTFTGDTPLHILVGRDARVSGEKVRVVGEALIAGGAKLEVRNLAGNTPLLSAVAVAKESADVVEALLWLGADPKVKSQFGWAIHQSGTPAVRRFLRDHLELESPTEVVASPNRSASMFSMG
jgi:ankyrin repeat protein